MSCRVPEYRLSQLEAQANQRWPTFLYVKQARGKLVSPPLPEIVGDVNCCWPRVPEIQLTSLGNAAYGLDTGHRLSELLDVITNLEGDYMVRVGMTNHFTLKDIVDDAVDAFQNPHIFRFLHLPIQSGSNQVLEHMHRRHTVEEFNDFIHRFVSRFPHLVLSNNFIVGYPTETDEDFEATT